MFMCDFSEADAGRQRAGEAGPSSQAPQEAGGKQEHPQEPEPESRAKATNFASYNWAASGRQQPGISCSKCSFLTPRLCGDSGV